MDQRRAVVRRLARDFNAVFIPFQELLNAALAREAPDYWLRDGVHPTRAGHELMADAWLKATADIC